MSNARKLADNLPSVGQLGNRNLIINGAMQVAQRGTSSTNNNTYGSVDRFFMSTSGLDQVAITQAQASDGPSGFSNSLKITITTAESSLAADELLSMRHRIEAQNLQLLDYNTSSAKTVTVSFYVKSSITGTYAFAIYNSDSGRNITNTYTINSANTWERKTIIIAGDTSGVIDNNNGYGFELSWVLSAGTTYTGGSGADSWHAYANNKYAAGHAVDVASTLNATWQVTGVQLEVGSQASPFEHEPISTTLAKCQRYFVRYDGNAEFVCQFYSTSSGDFNVATPVTMRTTPTLTTKDKENTANRITLYSNGYTHGHSIAIISSRSIGNIMTLRISGVSSGTVGVNEAVQVQFNDLRLDAEL